jgi:hypothetical protein
MKKHLAAVLFGIPVGIFVGLAIILGPLYPGSFLARIWLAEEKPIGWIISAAGAVGIAENHAMQLVILLHFAICALLPGILFYAVATLWEKLTND